MGRLARGGLNKNNKSHVDVSQVYFFARTKKKKQNGTDKCHCAQYTTHSSIYLFCFVLLCSLGNQEKSLQNVYVRFVVLLKPPTVPNFYQLFLQQTITVYTKI